MKEAAVVVEGEKGDGGSGSKGGGDDKGGTMTGGSGEGYDRGRRRNCVAVVSMFVAAKAVAIGSSGDRQRAAYESGDNGDSNDTRGRGSMRGGYGSWEEKEEGSGEGLVTAGCALPRASRQGQRGYNGRGCGRRNVAAMLPSFLRCWQQGGKGQRLWGPSRSTILVAWVATLIVATAGRDHVVEENDGSRGKGRRGVGVGTGQWREEKEEGSDEGPASIMVSPGPVVSSCKKQRRPTVTSITNDNGCRLAE
ncbi:hypothetical protein BHE74_00008711 [Ensete ventricosum]|nr:hypothetical protein BHE74_00008711 [Ensete ventricosum]